MLPGSFYCHNQIKIQNKMKNLIRTIAIVCLLMVPMCAITIVLLEKTTFITMFTSDETHLVKVIIAYSMLVFGSVGITATALAMSLRQSEKNMLKNP